MFDIGWSELLVIAVVAIVVVGPKDLPRMLRTFGNYAGKARKVANDFKRQFDEALREAELDDVRKSVEEMTKLPTLNDATKSTAKPDALVLPPNSSAEMKPAVEAPAPAETLAAAETPVAPPPAPEPVSAEPKQ
jgi:sec-independent protein translocase protein TatB